MSRCPYLRPVGFELGVAHARPYLYQKPSASAVLYSSVAVDQTYSVRMHLPHSPRDSISHHTLTCRLVSKACASRRTTMHRRDCYLIVFLTQSTSRYRLMLRVSSRSLGPHCLIPSQQAVSCRSHMTTSSPCHPAPPPRPRPRVRPRLQVERRACVASTIVGSDVVIFTASILASRWGKISPVVAEMIVRARCQK